MGRDHRHAAYAVILNTAGIDRRDRSAVGMPEQEAAAKADFVQQFWQNLERLDMHVVERPRQLDRRRGAIARARIDEHTGPHRGLKPVRKISPLPNRAKTFVQHDDGRRLVRCGTDHAVFEFGSADAEKAGGCESGHVFNTCGQIFVRHARACRGHPRLSWPPFKTWMAGSSPAMTTSYVPAI